MNRKANAGVRSGPFRRDGHKSHVRLAHMQHTKEFVTRLDADTARLKRIYQARSI